MDEKQIESKNDDSFDSTYEELAENIAEYYKNNLDESEPQNNNSTEEEVSQPQNKKSFFQIFKSFKKSNITVVGGTQSTDDIQYSNYGMTEKKKIYICLGSSIFVSLAIISASIMISFALHNESSANDEYINELRHNEDYIELQKEYSALTKEVNDLKNSLEEKKETVTYIDDYDNKKAELQLKIDAQKQEMNDITYNINQKQAEIEELDKIISDRSGTIITLSPGRYVVGTNIAAGKYSISGAGKLSVASSDNKSKINTVIGSTAYEATLEIGDIINLEMTAKFTSIN